LLADGAARRLYQQLWPTNYFNTSQAAIVIKVKHRLDHFLPSVRRVGTLSKSDVPTP
jgi:hypothetical protein